MKKILTILIFVTFSSSVYAQDISKADLEKRHPETADVPVAVDREIRTDQEFLEVFNWLMETPLPEAEGKRQVVNAALSNYIEQNELFDIMPDVEMLKFADTTPELVTVFMGGATAYIIKNDNEDPLKVNIAGVESVIEYYDRNEEYLSKDRHVEKLIRKAKKDKLEKYIDRKINIIFK